jgi:hypothetical protein
MGLSSNTILHQTSKASLEYFITKGGFPLSYCREFLRSNYLTPAAAFPMICFSDIPLSELHQHLQRYDDYTIGMTKGWAKSHKLNPVLYFEEKSTFTQSLVEKFDFAMQKHFFNRLDDDAKHEFYYFLYLLAFSKNYDGELTTKKVHYDNYRFSDEREWRYVPQVAEVEEEWFYKTYDDYDKNKPAYNKEISKYRLPFELTDINFIIVNDRADIDFFYDLLSKVFSKEITAKELTRIPVNFFTNDQIKSDFL